MGRSILVALAHIHRENRIAARALRTTLVSGIHVQGVHHGNGYQP